MKKLILVLIILNIILSCRPYRDMTNAPLCSDIGIRVTVSKNGEYRINGIVTTDSIAKKKCKEINLKN